MNNYIFILYNIIRSKLDNKNVQVYILAGRFSPTQKAVSTSETSINKIDEHNKIAHHQHGQIEQKEFRSKAKRRVDLRSRIESNQNEKAVIWTNRMQQISNLIKNITAEKSKQKV